jgi:hypothetical protein
MVWECLSERSFGTYSNTENTIIAMPQDSETGRKGSEYGLTCGHKIIAALGGTPIRRGSNEFRLNGELLSLHCAHKGNGSVGVTYKMLERVDAVLAAFEQPDESYLILRLSQKQYKRNMQPTRSLGPSSGRVGKVGRVVFKSKGSVFKTVRT